MTDMGSNGASDIRDEETIMPKTTGKPRKSAAQSARTFAETEATTSGASGAAEAETRLRAAVERVEVRAAELRQWSAVKADQAREIVEDKPLTVIGAAFGVGLLLGLLASR